MTRNDLQSLISLGETETVEFKKSTGTRRAAMQTLCAMLNHRGGYVLFGIDPTGKIIGADVGEHTVEKLSDEFKLFEPPIVPSGSNSACRKVSLLFFRASIKLDVMRRQCLAPFIPLRYSGIRFFKSFST